MKKIALSLLLFTTAIGAGAQTSQEVKIQMYKDWISGLYYFPADINGDSLEFLFDTGASTVCLPQAVADSMLERRILDPEDLDGPVNNSMADGSVLKGIRFNIRSLVLGGVELVDVDGIITNVKKPIIGQSVLKKVKSYSFDTDRHKLTIVFQPTFPEKCLEGDCENGKGTYQFDDGSIYSGDFKNGEMDGFGTLETYKKDYRYIGEWKRSYKHGKGTEIYAIDYGPSEGTWYWDKRHGLFKWTIYNGENRYGDYYFGEGGFPRKTP